MFQTVFKRYESKYFTDRRLIRASLEKPVYKEKLRLRTYGVPSDGSPCFIEIKKKYKGIVYKRRIPAAFADALKYLSGDTDCLPPVSDKKRDRFLFEPLRSA